MKTTYKRKRSGFTLIELIVVVVIFASLVIGILTICANCWYTKEGLMTELQFQDPAVQKIIRSQRNFVRESRIITMDDSGNQRKWNIDSNIFFNYRISLSGS